MARRIKGAGLRQRVVFGRGLVTLHWAAGAPGVVNVMTKNIFAATGFNPLVLLAGCLWLGAFCILPFVLLVTRGFVVPGAITVGAIAWDYFLVGRYSGLSGWNVLLAPFAAALLGFAMLRSMVTTLRQGGVVWRGTFYPLATLRKYAKRP
jgi:hypothetical protein